MDILNIVYIYISIYLYIEFKASRPEYTQIQSKECCAVQQAGLSIQHLEKTRYQSRIPLTMTASAAGSTGGHNHWTLEGARPDTGRRHYEYQYKDEVVLAPSFYTPERSASEAERKLAEEMSKFQVISKQKTSFDRLLRAFADAAGGPRGDVSQLEAAIDAIQMEGVGRETLKYIAASCQALFGLECRASFTLSQCAVVAEKFFQSRQSLPAAQVADDSAYLGVNMASNKLPILANQNFTNAKSLRAQPPLYTSRSHGDILGWNRGGTERSHVEGLIPQTPPVPR